MAVSDEVATKLREQIKGPTEPEKKEKAETGLPSAQRAESGWSVGSSIGRAIDEGGAALATGFAETADFIKGAAAGVAMPLIPERYSKAGALIPVKDEDTPAADLAQKLLKPISETPFVDSLKERAEHPTTAFGKVMNPGLKGAGGMAAMPMLSAEKYGVEAIAKVAKADFWRNFIVGFGMGEGSEIGKKTLGGIFEYFLGPEARTAGEQTGSILGGGAGSTANLARVNAVAGPIGKASQAWRNAKEIDAARTAALKAGEKVEDQRKMWQIFSDEFSDLRGKTKGIIQQKMNAQMADALQRSGAGREVAGFEGDIATTGATAAQKETFGLAERTKNPILASLMTEERPRGFTESVSASERSGKMQRVISDLYNKLVGPKGLPDTPEGLKASGDAFRAITEAKLQAIQQEENAAKATFPPLGGPQQYAVGDVAHQLRDQRARTAYTEAERQYSAAESMWEAEGATVRSGGLRQQEVDMINSFYGQADPATVPKIVKSVLRATGSEQQLFDAAGRPYADPYLMAKELSLKDANDLVKAFGKAANEYNKRGESQAFSNAKALQDRVLAEIEGAQATPAAKQAYTAARENYRVNYAEPFQEGAGRALGKEKVGPYAGQEVMANEKVLPYFLNKDEMTSRLVEYDKVYGKSPEAQQILQAGVADRFRSEVLDAGASSKAIEPRLEKFRKEYESALNRMPALADRIESEAANIYKMRAEKEAQLDRYKDLMKGPVTKEVTAVQAKQMFQAALADPAKMTKLLDAMPSLEKDLVKEVFQQANPMQGDRYDAKALRDMLNAGKTKLQGPSSMQIMFERAFGKEGGDRQFQVLEAIARLQEREALTNPENLRPKELFASDPIKRTTGQTGASWIQSIRTAWARQTGVTYVTALGLSRFALARVTQAVDNAKLKALYDPPTTEAILELMSKGQGEPLSMTTGNAVWGGVKGLVGKMVEAGYIKRYVPRGMVYGAADEDQSRREREGKIRAHEAVRER